MGLVLKDKEISGLTTTPPCTRARHTQTRVLMKACSQQRTGQTVITQITAQNESRSSLCVSGPTGRLRWGCKVRYQPSLSSGRPLWQRCGCCNTHNPHKLLFEQLSWTQHIFTPRLRQLYLFQVALAPARFCFSPLSSGELFSLFPSSLRLGELINLSRCRVLMG